MKVELTKEGFILTKDNARPLKNLFGLLGHEGYQWIEYHLNNMLKHQGREYMIYCTNKTIRKNIEEYINDNSF